VPDAWLAPRLALTEVGTPSDPLFSIEERPPATRFVFRGGDSARGSCSRAFDVDLPQRLGSAATGEDRVAIWLGPDEWLLIAEGVDPDVIGAELEAALEATPHGLVDVSHRQIGLDVSGSFAARALSAGCPLDLRLSAFPAGMATRTIFDKAEIVLWRGEDQAFRVEVARSFAPFVVASLMDAAGIRRGSRGNLQVIAGDRKLRIR
jgi:sarcosine oxidase subunit gamma